jgi:hypothetical protein
MPPGGGHGYFSVVNVACVLSGRGLCEGLITRPEECVDCGVSLCVIMKP